MKEQNQKGKKKEVRMKKKWGSFDAWYKVFSFLCMKICFIIELISLEEVLINLL
jgi:hypothetical protein